jgi:integrase/recombinase XerC
MGVDVPLKRGILLWGVLEEMEVDGYISYLRREVKKSEKTAIGYQGDLQGFRRFLDGRDMLLVSNEMARAYQTTLNDQGLKPTTVHRKLAACKSFYRYLKRKGMVQTNPFDDMEMPRIPERLPKFITASELDQLLSFPGVGPLDLRDRAMILLMHDTGVRVAGLAAINVDDVDFDTREIRVIEKGDKERIVIFSDRADYALHQWLDARDSKDEALFVNHKGHRLPPDGIQWVLETRSERTLGKRISPHWLRHSFATQLVNGGVDMAIISELMGHANVQTTKSIYAHVQRTTLHRAYETVHPRLEGRESLKRKLRIVS